MTEFQYPPLQLLLSMIKIKQTFMQHQDENSSFDVIENKTWCLEILKKSYFFWIFQPFEKLAGGISFIQTFSSDFAATFSDIGSTW